MSARKKFHTVHFDIIRRLAETKTDKEAVKEFNEIFRENLTKTAFTKLRQRANVRKEGWRGHSQLAGGNLGNLEKGNKENTVVSNI